MNIFLKVPKIQGLIVKMGTTLEYSFNAELAFSFHSFLQKARTEVFPSLFLEIRVQVMEPMSLQTQGHINS